MKVISGEFKGIRIEGNDIEGTRPTMDRVKESLFGTIQNYVKGSTVLDLFAGSGNLGLEAISNGASFAYFNDVNKKSIKVIKDNVTRLDINNRCKILNKDYMSVLKYIVSENIKLDIIFSDPPYDLEVIEDILLFIDENNILNKNGLVVCEYNKLDIDKEYQNLEIIKTKKYGDKYITIYKRDQK